MGHNSRKMQRLSCRAHYVAGIDLAGESKEPPNVGLQGPSSPSGGRGTPTLGDFLPPDRLHKHKWAEQAGLPSPAPESRTFHRLPPPPTTKTKLPPTIEDPPQEDSISQRACPHVIPRLREGSGAGNSAQSRITPSPQNPRYQLTIGIRRSRPKFLGVIFTPGAACRRLYSFRSTALITRFTISSSNPMLMMSAGDLSCST